MLIFLSHPGVAVRFWQLGLEMRPLFRADSLWALPVFAGVGASFGYWLQGVDQRQNQVLADRRNVLLEKRRRRAEREGKESKSLEEIVGSKLRDEKRGLA